MSTPSASNNSRPIPRMNGALTPSASTPSRIVSSPAHLANSKIVGRSPWKGAPSASQTPLLGSVNAHTPTPFGSLPPGSSPALTLDGLVGRARAGTIGTKSIGGSPAAQTPTAFSSLGLTLTPFGGELNITQQLNDSSILDTLGLGGRDAEVWTAQRIKEIVDLLGTQWGKVSQENVKRCVDRIGGLECYWEDHPGGKEKVGERKRTLAIAGNEMMLEIVWLGDRVTRVVLHFMRGTEEATDELGAQVLLQDLVGTGVEYVELNGFVENLTRLARIDQLGRGKVSCFEALDGISYSMKKLWELELGKEQETTKNQTVAELKTLCERSGRPVINSDNKIGLRLDYWMDRRDVAERDIEDRMPSESVKNPFCLMIDCEAFNATQYPSIRISQAWLSISVADAISDPTLPIWDDPPPTFIPGTEMENVQGMLSLGITTGTQPDVRFIARLRPAVTLPLNAAAEILAHMDSPLTQEAIGFTTYLGLLFPGMPDFRDGTKDGKVRIKRFVTSYDASGLRHEHSQRFDVFSVPNTWARTITELPFSHPRQLTDILPYLRQWAFFGRLLQRSFGETHADLLSEKVSNPVTFPQSMQRGNPTTKRSSRPSNGYRHRYQQYEPPSDTESDGEEVNAVKMNSGNAGIISNISNSAGQIIDVGKPEIVIETSFDISTITRRIDMAISIIFLHPRGEDSSCAINLKIHPNAKLEVDDDLAFRGGIFESNFKPNLEAENMRRKLERVLRITEDLGAAAMWLRNLYNQPVKK